MNRVKLHSRLTRSQWQPPKLKNPRFVSIQPACTPATTQTIQDPTFTALAAQPVAVPTKPTGPDPFSPWSRSPPCHGYFRLYPRCSFLLTPLRHCSNLWHPGHQLLQFWHQPLRWCVFGAEWVGWEGGGIVFFMCVRWCMRWLSVCIFAVGGVRFVEATAREHDDGMYHQNISGMAASR